jgi:hypothetical protein
MIETAFTPGPWDVDGKSIIGRKAAYVLQDFGPYEGVSWIDYGNVTPEECEANKALIAAAPELYSMVEKLTRKLSMTDHELVSEADAILARARGKSQTLSTD